MVLPLLIWGGIILAGAVGFGSGVAVSSGTKKLLWTTAIASGTVLAVKFGPDIIKAVRK